MAKVKFSAPVEAYQGKMGTQVFQERNGQAIVGQKPRSNREPSEAELAHRERFLEAVEYANDVMVAPALREEYEEVASRTGAPIFSLPVSDFLNPPEITKIDLAAYEGRKGDLITIEARDDHKVASVAVVLTDGDGILLEEGAAEPHPESRRKWVYAATVSVPAEMSLRLAATAADRAGNKTTDEVEVVLEA